MDSSTFVQNQTTFSTFANPAANSNDQPVDYGPLVFKVMHAVSQRLAGVEYLIGKLETLNLTFPSKRGENVPGLSLRDPDDPTISQLAATAQTILGDELDAYLLGNVSFPAARILLFLMRYQTGTRSLLSPRPKTKPRQLHCR